jgi:hypothetical protein
VVTGPWRATLFKELSLPILDEATSALDTEMGRRVARTMATRPERYIQDSIDALGRGGDGGPHRAPAPRAIENVDLLYVPGARGVWPRRARTTRCARAGSRAFARRPEMQRL